MKRFDGFFEKVAPLFLIMIGCIAMFADLFGFPAIRGAATAWGASVLPKVFSSVEGLETFSLKIEMTIVRKNGEVEHLPFSKREAHRLKGPYNRRNVYGALLVYGPLFQKNSKIAPMVDTMLVSIAKDREGFLHEFGLDCSTIERIEIEVFPKHPELCPHLSLKKVIHFPSNGEVACHTE